MQCDQYACSRGDRVKESNGSFGSSPKSSRILKKKKIIQENVDGIRRKTYTQPE